MGKSIDKHILCVAGVVIGAGLTCSNLALAQSAVPPAPVARSVDSNGVDLLSQTLTTRDLPSISSAGISWTPTGLGKQDSLTGAYHSSLLGFGDQSIDLGKLNGRYATLSCTSTTPGVGTCTMTTADGTQVIYDKTKTSNVGIMANVGLATQVIKPDGEILTYNYQPWGPYSYPSIGTLNSQLLISVTSSLGWMVKYGTVGVSSFAKVYIVNTSVDYCDPTATADCTSANSSSWPTMTVAQVGTPYNGLLFTDALGNATLAATYVSWTGPTNYFYALKGVQFPSGRTKMAFLDGNDGYKVASYTIGSSVWQYVNPHPAGGTDDRTTVTDPLGHTQILIHESASGSLRLALSYQDELGRVTKYTVNDTQGITRVILPEASYSGATPTGGYTDYTRDGRNNITTVTVVPKGGGTPSVTQINYPTSCSDPKSCNKPTYVIDPNGKQTDYTYDTTGAHGGILTETGPADSAGVRPQTRYTYTKLYPQVLNSAGTLVSSPGVWRLTKTSSCRTATSANPASCVGTDQETVTEYVYGTNNLLLTKVTVRAGNANVATAASPTNVWQTTTYTYDYVGNRTSVDGPLPGANDTSYTVYDILRRPVYEIGIDPDGGGSLQRVTIHHLYDSDGREYRTETGTGNSYTLTCSPTATTCTYFTVMSYVQRTYDSATGLEVKSVTAQP